MTEQNHEGTAKIIKRATLSVSAGSVLTAFIGMTLGLVCYKHILLPLLPDNAAGFLGVLVAVSSIAYGLLIIHGEEI